MNKNPLFVTSTRTQREGFQGMKQGQTSILTVNGGSSSIKFALFEVEPSHNARNATVISTDASRVAVRVMRTDEELMIARSVSRLLNLNFKIV